MRMCAKPTIGIDASNVRTGGGLTHLGGVLSTCNPDQHNFERLVVWAGGSTLAQLPTRPWIRYLHVGELDRALPVRIAWQQHALSGQVAGEGCNVLFSPGGIVPGNLRTPAVTMSQNLLPFSPNEARRYFPSAMWFRLFLLRQAQSRTYRAARNVIFLTEHAQSVIAGCSRLRDGRQRVIPHGIDESFRRPPRAQLALERYSERNPFRFLYVSTIDVYKHQCNVAQAVAQLRETLPVTLELVGPAYGPALRRLRRVLKQIDPHRRFVHYRGAVRFSELPQTYHSADAFVFASTCENMPNILVEAMASGLPIVCSQSLPMPDILGRGGIYANPLDPAALAAGIRRILVDHRLRSEIADIAFKRAQVYSWARCTKLTFAFLNEVVEGPPPQASARGTVA